MTTLGQLGERNIIDRLVARLDSDCTVVCGPGDDAAIVRVTPDAAADFALTSDAVIEGRHFPAQAPPAAVGRKALARALSDLAAMGSNPQWALIDVVAPATLDVATVEDAYEGAVTVAAEHGLVIVGGDTAEGTPFALHVFAVGTLPRDRAIYRSGAADGDILFVTGTLGGSSLGHHLTFTPRVREGAWLCDWASSMIDLSDGLAADVRHIAARSAVGFVIKEQDIPISESARRVDDGYPASLHALRDGEDYELLFTIPADRVTEFKKAWAGMSDLACTQIGTATAHAGQIGIESASGRVSLLDDEGYEHFVMAE